MSEKVLRLATVDFERNGVVYVAAPMSGFPVGTRLEKGDKVALVEDSRGRLCVKPYVRTTHAIARGPGRRREGFTVFCIDGESGTRVLAARAAQ